MTSSYLNSIPMSWTPHLWRPRALDAWLVPSFPFKSIFPIAILVSSHGRHKSGTSCRLCACVSLASCLDVGRTAARARRHDRQRPLTSEPGGFWQRRTLVEAAGKPAKAAGDESTAPSIIFTMILEVSKLTLHVRARVSRGEIIGNMVGGRFSSLVALFLDYAPIRLETSPPADVPAPQLPRPF